MLSLSVILPVLLAATPALALCPTSCTCTNNTKVSCNRQHFTRLPSLRSTPSGITSLSFFFNNLTFLPSRYISRFGDLTYFDVHHNQLTSVPDSFFKNSTKLETLFLSENRLTSLPAGLLSNCRKLTLLGLFSNQLTTLDGNFFASQRSNLAQLYLNNNKFRTVPEQLLQNLNGLKFLQFALNNITSWFPNQFAGLRNAEQIHIAHNPFTHLPETLFHGMPNAARIEFGYSKLANLSNKIYSMNTKLQQSGLQGVPLKSAPQGLYANNPILSAVLFQDNPNLVSLPASLFTNKAKLTLMLVRRNPKLATFPVLPSLARLTSMEVSGNAIASLSKDTLQGAKGLMRIDFSQNKLQTIPSGLFDGLSHLEELFLNGNDIVSLPADLLSKTPNIGQLDLAENRIASIPKGFFYGHHELFAVFLNNNDIGSLAPDTFKDSTALEEVDLAGNRLTSLPPSLLRSQNYPQLSFVAVDNNPFTNALGALCAISSSVLESGSVSHSIRKDMERACGAARVGCYISKRTNLPSFYCNCGSTNVFNGTHCVSPSVCNPRNPTTSCSRYTHCNSKGCQCGNSQPENEHCACNAKAINESYCQDYSAVGSFANFDETDGLITFTISHICHQSGQFTAFNGAQLNTSVPSYCQPLKVLHSVQVRLIEYTHGDAFNPTSIVQYLLHGDTSPLFFGGSVINGDLTISPRSYVQGWDNGVCFKKTTSGALCV